MKGSFIMATTTTTTKARTTLWCVTYAMCGAYRTKTRWFDNREEAYEFTKGDYRDKPVAHHFKPEKAQKIMREQQIADAYNDFCAG